MCVYIYAYSRCRDVAFQQSAWQRVLTSCAPVTAGFATWCRLQNVGFREEGRGRAKRDRGFILVFESILGDIWLWAGVPWAWSVLDSGLGVWVWGLGFTRTSAAPAASLRRSAKWTHAPERVRTRLSIIDYRLSIIDLWVVWIIENRFMGNGDSIIDLWMIDDEG